MAFDFLDKDLPAKERSDNLKGHVVGLAGATALLSQKVRKHPGLAALGLMAYMNHLHGERGSIHSGQSDYGDYFSSDGERSGADGIDTMTKRVLGDE